MKVYRSIEQFKKVSNAVVTTGTFDGVHIGHRRIISRVNEVASRIGGESVVLTFDPHPRMVLFPEDNDLRLITTLDEKIGLLQEAGVQNLIVHPFTKAFSRTTSIDFIREILVNQLGTSVLVIGYDHHFGRNREGSFEHLKESGPLYGFQVEEIPVQDVDEVAVSSTKIRKALEEGNVAVARQYLACPFRISGFVTHGDKLGRSLGFPTANVHVTDQNKLIPANGVYACYVNVVGRKFCGMLNIGHRPTVNGHAKRIEVNIFDFDTAIYGEDIVLELQDRIRDERKFDNLEQLKAQLALDELKARSLL